MTEMASVIQELNNFLYQTLTRSQLVMIIFITTKKVYRNHFKYNYQKHQKYFGNFLLHICNII